MRRAALLAIAAWIVGAPPSQAEPPPVRVGMEGEAEAYAHVAENFGGRRCPALERYEYFDPGVPSRPQGDLLLLCHALRLGGFDGVIEPVYVHNYNRALAEAVAGRIDIPSQTVWSGELAERREALLPSAPVIREGEWAVGLYTTENRADVLGVRTPEEARGLIAAVPRGWVEDWRALEALDLKGLVDVQENKLIKAMIAEGRADFTLDLFGRAPDLGYDDEASGLRMLPIPGLKLPLPASRHFAVSTARPDAAELIAALDRGLAELRARGAIAAVMEDVGLFEPRVAGWTAVLPKHDGNN